MKNAVSLLISLLILLNVIAQNNDSSDEQKLLIPPPEWTVPFHKEHLKLTLFIDSVRIGSKTFRLDFHKTLNIDFESDYLQVRDDLFIKLFIARNQEYGKKFYSWKWDYLRKKGSEYHSLGIGYYSPMDFNQPLTAIGDYGQGIGNEGESDYLMLYFRYRLE